MVGHQRGCSSHRAHGAHSTPRWKSTTSSSVILPFTLPPSVRNGTGTGWEEKALAVCLGLSTMLEPSDFMNKEDLLNKSKAAALVQPVAYSSNLIIFF